MISLEISEVCKPLYLSGACGTSVVIRCLRAPSVVIQGIVGIGHPSGFGGSRWAVPVIAELSCAGLDPLVLEVVDDVHGGVHDVA